MMKCIVFRMTARHKVLFLDPAGLLWGSERALLDFISNVPSFEAACCCPPETPLVGKLEEKGVRVFPYFVAELNKKGLIARLAGLVGLVRAIVKFHPALIHVNQAGATKIALAAAKLFGLPVISHVRLLEDVEYLGRLRASSRSLRRVISVSKSIDEALGATDGLSGIARTLIPDAYCRTGAGCRGHGAIEQEFVCVGRFCKGKGQHLLIEALAILAKKGSYPQVAFVGGINEYGEEMKRLARRYEVAEQCRFVGHLDHVSPLLVSSAWLVCSSAYESLGRVLFEAWDHGIPVIAGSFSGGAAESVRGSGGGLMFDLWSAESLANALERALLTGEAEAAGLAAAGLEWMTSATDPGRYAEQVAEVFRSALKGD
jgi:glycosyltransferase involved in cell wall biosynthesis